MVLSAYFGSQCLTPPRFESHLRQILVWSWESLSIHLSKVGGFLQALPLSPSSINIPPRYTWNNVDWGIKFHHFTPTPGQVSSVAIHVFVSLWCSTFNDKCHGFQYLTQYCGRVAGSLLKSVPIILGSRSLMNSLGTFEPQIQLWIWFVCA